MIPLLKEAWICLRAGRVTLPYPLQPMKAPQRFRGRPTIDGSKCLGCGACAEVCPPRLITVTDEGALRTVALNYSRCTYCARCQEICPSGAATCTEDFETATANRHDLGVAVKLDLIPCRTCGSSFITRRMLDKMIDEFCPPWMKDKFRPQPAKVGLAGDPMQAPDWFGLCPACRAEKTGAAIERSVRHE